MFTYEQIINKTYTEEQKQNLNRVAKLLKQGTTKEDVMELLNTNERTARDYISSIGYMYPIISSAGEKGYRFALTPEDVPDNEKKIWDRLSRIEEMLYTILPNIEFEHKNNIKFERLEKSITEFISALHEPKIAQYFTETNKGEKNGN